MAQSVPSWVQVTVLVAAAVVAVLVAVRRMLLGPGPGAGDAPALDPDNRLAELATLDHEIVTTSRKNLPAAPFDVPGAVPVLRMTSFFLAPADRQVVAHPGFVAPAHHGDHLRPPPLFASALMESCADAVRNL